MSKLEMKKNFNITKEADDFAKDLIKDSADIKTAKDLAILGMILAFSNSSHLEIKATPSVHKIRFSDFDFIDGIALIYSSLFPKEDHANVWINLEKAASSGIILIRDEYYSKSDNLIDWEKINQDFN